MTPHRIQLRRTKGWRKPADAIVVARPSKWGNPWRVGEVLGVDIDSDYDGGVVIDAELAVDLYRRALTGPERHGLVICGLAITVDDVRRELAGHDLACWCPLEDAHGRRPPCHADVLLELANTEPGP